MDPFLVKAITGFGFLMTLLCFLVIFLGKRIPGDTGSPQEVEFKGFKMKTNGVVTLLVICVVVTVLPLSLQALLISQKQPAGSAMKAQDLQLYITGQVLDAEGRAVEGAKVTVTNMKNEKPGNVENPVASRMTDGSGSFDFPPLSFGEGDRYKVVAEKEGHVEQNFYMGPSGAVDVKTVLVAKRVKGGGL